MDTLNSPQQPGSDPGDSRQDGAGDQAQKRVDDLMGLANRRLTQAQRAEAERDAARAEVEALRAAMKDGWAAERAAYWQQQSPVDEIVQAAPVEAEAEDGVEQVDEVDPNYNPDTDFTPPSQPRNDPNMAPRSAAVPVGAGGSELDAARAAFQVASELENERLRALREWP